MPIERQFIRPLCQKAYSKVCGLRTALTSHRCSKLRITGVRAGVSSLRWRLILEQLSVGRSTHILTPGSVIGGAERTNEI
jgi:hypothetical protein